MNSQNWKRLIPYTLHQQARTTLENEDYFTFFTFTDNTLSIPLLVSITQYLLNSREYGMFEKILIHALTISRNNNIRFSAEIKGLLEFANYDALRSMGYTISTQDNYRLFRGVSGIKCDIIERGYHWTDSLAIARKFAVRRCDFCNPRVLTTVISNESILFYSNERSEQEYFLDMDNLHSNQDINVEIFESM